LEREKREKIEEFERIKAQQAAGKKGNSRNQKASAVGEWRPYRDKRGRGIFYYNRVSRVSHSARKSTLRGHFYLEPKRHLSFHLVHY